MEDDCEDIYTNGLIKRYTMRTSSLENVTLADWAAWYDMCGKPYVKQSNELDVDMVVVVVVVVVMVMTNLVRKSFWPKPRKELRQE